VVTERFTRRPALFTRPGGRRRGQERVSGCEMALADVTEARDPLGRAGERALRGVAGPGEDLLVHVLLARLAQERLCAPRVPVPES
jgi:hypothetical protein